MKKLEVTKVTLADSQDNARNGMVFAICELQEVSDGKGVSKLRKHSVIGVEPYNWLIDISDYEGRNNDAKLENARKDLVGEVDEFNTCVISIDELTKGAHKGFTIPDSDTDYGVISTRRLVGYESEDELCSRELGRLNRQAKDGIIVWSDEEGE